MDRKGFEAVIAEALDGLPLEFAELMSNVSIQVREAPDVATLRSLDLDPRHHTLFGLYTGVPLDERGGWYGNVLPDVIVLYRRPLLDYWCETGQSLEAIVRNTLIHEIGHHFGFSDDDMERIEAEL